MRIRRRRLRWRKCSSRRRDRCWSRRRAAGAARPSSRRCTLWSRQADQLVPDARRSVRAHPRAGDGREKFLSVPDHRLQPHRGHRENSGDGRARPEAAGGDHSQLRPNLKSARRPHSVRVRIAHDAGRNTSSAIANISEIRAPAIRSHVCAKPHIHLVAPGRQRDAVFRRSPEPRLCAIVAVHLNLPAGIIEQAQSERRGCACLRRKRARVRVQRWT